MSSVYLDRPTIVYPESDGKPMADNTRQFECIVMIKDNLEALFAADQNVFVAGDHLWYPVEGRPGICAAPDVYVAFGRPKGHRGSYKQWQEGAIAPQVVFEIRSPNNTDADMAEKLDFYQRYGVQEYYVYDPDRGELSGYQRQGDRLHSISVMQGYRSPRLEVRFELAEGELQLYGPDGRRFLTFVELSNRNKATEQRVEQEQRHREAAEQRADQERLRADQECLRADQAQQQTERFAALLRQHGIEPPPDLVSGE